LESYKVYAKAVAKFCDSDPSKILDILNLSEKNKIFYHGVRRSDAVDSILENGIEPSTPEAMGGTYFATGVRLFLNLGYSPDSGMSTYDTPFFHYAHNDNGMCLVFTDERRLSRYGMNVPWRRDSDIIIKGKLPPWSIRMLHLNSKSGKVSSRMEAALLERRMIDLLQAQLKIYYT